MGFKPNQALWLDFLEIKEYKKFGITNIPFKNFCTKISKKVLFLLEVAFSDHNGVNGPL